MSNSLNSQTISVHPLTDNPTSAWEKIKMSQKCLKIQPPLPKGPVANNKVCKYINILLNFSISIYNVFEIRSELCV